MYTHIDQRGNRAGIELCEKTKRLNFDQAGEEEKRSPLVRTVQD